MMGEHSPSDLFGSKTSLLEGNHRPVRSTTLDRGQKTFRKVNDRGVKKATKDYLFDHLLRKHVEGDESRFDL